MSFTVAISVSLAGRLVGPCGVNRHECSHRTSRSMLQDMANNSGRRSREPDALKQYAIFPITVTILERCIRVVMKIASDRFSTRLQTKSLSVDDFPIQDIQRNNRCTQATRLCSERDNLHRSQVNECPTDQTDCRCNIVFVQ